MNDPEPIAGWVNASLAASIERFAAEMQYADVGWGDPGTSDGWFPYEALSDPPFADSIRQRIARDYQTTDAVAGTWAFRAAHYLPIALAGFMFAADRRVPRLQQNVALLDRQYLSGIRLLKPEAIVLEDDPLASAPGCVTVTTVHDLTDCLFTEVAQLVSPVLDRFQSYKWVARANAWNVVIDFLAYGFLAAGRTSLGLDAAWSAWEQAMAGRTFPARRRPRRLRFVGDDGLEEIMVQSHCCLQFTMPRVKEMEHPYCASCYLESDECRIRRILADQTTSRGNQTDDRS